MPGFMWPNGLRTKPYVSSAFGPRRAPIQGASTFHRGTDFSHTFSTIRAVADGQVKVAGSKSGWGAGGNQVWVQHDGFFSRSLHMSSVSVVDRQFVRTGDVLGIMGRTGTATDTHLHFEITPGQVHSLNTGQVDPVPFISTLINTGSAGSGAGSAEDMGMTAEEWRQFQVLAGTVNGIAEQIPALSTRIANVDAWVSAGGAGVEQGVAAAGTIASRVINLDRQVTGAQNTEVNLVQHVLDIKASLARGGMTDAQIDKIAAEVASSVGLNPEAVATAVRAKFKSEPLS